MSAAPKLAPDLLLPGQGPAGGSIPGLSVGLMRAGDPQGFVSEWTVGHFERRLQTNPSLFSFRLGWSVSALRQSVCSRPGRGATVFTVVGLAISQAGSHLSLCAHFVSTV